MLARQHPGYEDERMVLLFFYAGRRWGRERPLIASCYSLRQGTLPERAMKVRKAWLADAG